jgi:hypothetical protein
MEQVAFIIALVGLALFIIGWRGRRTDDHPLCRRCGFDLTGRPPESIRCAECGADLAMPWAIRVGHRRKRGILLALGVVVTLSATLTLGVRSFVNFDEIDLLPYTPAWMLERDLAAGPHAANRSLSELTRRLNAGTLSDAHVKSVAGLCLTKQGSVNLAWNPAWGRFIETARAVGRLPDDAWEQYARQAFVFSIEPEPASSKDFMPNAVARGLMTDDLVTINLSIHEVRVAGAAFTAFLEWKELLVDDRAAGRIIAGPLPRRYFARVDVAATRIHTNQSRPTIDLSRGEKPVPGVHSFRAKFNMRVYDGSGVPAAGRSLPLPAGAKQLTEETLDLNASIDIPDVPNREREAAGHLSL